MNCNPEQINALAAKLGEKLVETDSMLATAESCTGGGIAYYLTEVAGSSAWFDCSFVTYSNAAKQALLQVHPQTLAAYGAVSEQTASEMLAGTLAHSQAQLAIVTTGIAGPDGGTVSKPVGTIYLGWQLRDQNPRIECHHFSGNRAEIRRQTIYHCLETALTIMG